MYAVLIAAMFAVVRDPPRPIVAIVLDIAGDPVLVDGQEKRPLRRMDLLRAGHRLDTAKGTRVVFLHDGHLEVVKAGSVEVGTESGQPADAVERREAKLNPRSLSALRDQARSGRIGATSFRNQNAAKEKLPVAGLTPMNGSTVLTDRPELVWPAAKGAIRYQVNLWSGVEGKLEQPIWRTTVEQARLPFPEKQKPLTLGNSYRWEVRAIREDDRTESLHWASFLVAPKRTIERTQQAEELAKNDDPGERLLAAMLYESVQVRDRALVLYEKLAEQSPNDGNLWAALATYYERAGQVEKSKESWERAKKFGVSPPKD